MAPASCHSLSSGRPAYHQLSHQVFAGDTKLYAEKGMIYSNAWASLTKFLKELGMYTSQVCIALEEAT